MTIAGKTMLNFVVAAILLAGALSLASPAAASSWEVCIDNVLYLCELWGNYVLCVAVDVCI